MGEDLQHVYTLEDVERLLGLHEGPRRRDTRDITYLDLLSWSSDAGTADMRGTDGEASSWTQRRGPLHPAEELALVLYDLERGMKQLPIVEQAVVALTACGFSPAEIAQIMDGKAVDPRTDGREYERRRKLFGRLVEGRFRRDKDGNPLLNDAGEHVVTGGIARRLMRGMNGRHISRA